MKTPDKTKHLKPWVQLVLEGIAFLSVFLLVSLYDFEVSPTGILSVLAIAFSGIASMWLLSRYGDLEKIFEPESEEKETKWI